MKKKECTSKDTQSVALTIYNDDFGLVEKKSSDRLEFSLSVQKKSNLTVEFEYEMDTTIHFRKD